MRQSTAAWGDRRIVTIERAIGFLVFAVAAAVTPGPSNLILTSIGARAGVRRGLPFLFGAVIGMGGLLFAVAFGAGRLVLERPRALYALKWIGAAFLLWLAWKIASGGALTAEDGPRARQAGFRDGALLQVINPKSWLVCASAAATYLDEGSGGALSQSLALGLLFIAAALPGCFPWLAFGATLQRRLQTEGAARRFHRAMGAALALSVILVLR